MPTIDCHAHLIAPEAIERLAAELPDQAPVFEQRAGGRFLVYPGGRVSGPLPDGMTDLGARLADMDRLGIDIQLISPTPPQFGYRHGPDAATTQARIVNDATLALVDAAPTRLRALLTLPVQDVDSALDELERLGDDDAVRGVELGANVAGVNLDDARFEPLWDELERRRLFTLIHPAPAEAEQWSRHFLRNLVGNPFDSTLALASLIFGGVIDRHPDLPFCFVHGGGFAPYQIGRWDRGWELRPDLRDGLPQPPSSYFSRVFFDTLTHDPGALHYLGDRVGWDRILLGSDYCFDMADDDPVASVRALELDPVDERAVLGGTLHALVERTTHEGTGN